MKSLKPSETEKVARSTFGQTALQAYRDDLIAFPGQNPETDSGWIAVANLLEHASLAVDSPAQARRVRERALVLARALLGEVALARGCAYDDHAATTDVDVIRLLAETAENGGRLRLARAMLEAAFPLAEDALSEGRLQFDRARNARKQGRIDLARAQFENLLRIGRRKALPELQALAYLGLGGCAQASGNFAEVRRLSRLAIRYTDLAGMRRFGANARMGMGIGLAMAGQYGEAVTHLWRAYQLAEDDALVAQDAGCNLAHVLLLSGRPREARVLSSSLLRTALPLRIALPALGGFAIASARLDLAVDVEWVTEQIRRIDAAASYPREYAIALVECSAALEAVGFQGSEEMRRQGEAIAVKHGFHDLTFAEAVASARSPAPPSRKFGGPAARATKEILGLEADHPDIVKVYA